MSIHTPSNLKPSRSIHPFLVCALIAVLQGLSIGHASSQTFMTLHHFSGGGGASSFAGLALSNSTLYGTTMGPSDDGGVVTGTVFAVSTDGTGFATLRHLASGPFAGLIFSDGTLYGTTMGGTQPSVGTSTVFAANIDGNGFTNLHVFTPVPGYAPFANVDGSQPMGGLVLSGATLYGTASSGGNAGKGTVFVLNTNGSGFIILHHFTGADGSYPRAGLILTGNTLYGTTANGGISGNGTVFAIKIDGSGFTNFYNFTATSISAPYGNADGAVPGELILSGNTLYGTASQGGSSGEGTVFAVSTNGTGFRTLHSFTTRTGVPYANSDGAYPKAGLILLGEILYGTAAYGGSLGQGTLFAVHTDGTGFTNLHSFNGGSDGSSPRGRLTYSGNTLYGTTAYGGSSGEGTVFSFSFPLPQLTIVRSGANVILSWPTSFAGFDFAGYTLQSTTNLSLPNCWFPVGRSPATNGGQISVMVLSNVGFEFFRLKSP
jgi:uncharacterized repeat protein (TIGR03803 family)